MPVSAAVSSARAVSSAELSSLICFSTSSLESVATTAPFSTLVPSMTMSRILASSPSSLRTSSCCLAMMSPVARTLTTKLLRLTIAVSSGTLESGLEFAPEPAFEPVASFCSSANGDGSGPVPPMSTVTVPAMAHSPSTPAPATSLMRWAIDPPIRRHRACVSSESYLR